MKKKLTEMNKAELLDYIQKWVRNRAYFRSGSSNWRKATRRIKRAEKMILRAERVQ